MKTIKLLIFAAAISLSSCKTHSALPCPDFYHGSHKANRVYHYTEDRFYIPHKTPIVHMDTATTKVHAPKTHVPKVKKHRRKLNIKLSVRTSFHYEKN